MTVPTHQLEYLTQEQVDKAKLFSESYNLFSLIIAIVLPRWVSLRPFVYAS
jgi:hypothetical protein